jgi:hypothetical protein
LEQQAQQYRQQAEDYAHVANNPALRHQKGDGYVANDRKTPTYEQRQQEKLDKQKKRDEINAQKTQQEIDGIAANRLKQGATNDPKIAQRAAEIEISTRKGIEEKVRSFEGSKKQKKDYQDELQRGAPTESLVRARDEIHPGAKMHPEDAPAVTRVDPKTDYPFGFYNRPGFDRVSKTVHDTFHSSFDERLAPKLDRLDSKTLKALGLEGDGASIVAKIKEEMQFTMEGSSVHGRSYDRVNHTGHTGKPFDSGNRDKLSDYDIAIVSPTLYRVSQASFIQPAEDGKAKIPRTRPLEAKDLDKLGLDKEARDAIQRTVTDSTKLGHPVNFKIYSGEGRDPNALNLPPPKNEGGTNVDK